MGEKKPTGFDYVIILIVFAVTGSTAAWFGKLIMPHTGLEGGWQYWLSYILIITPIYQILLLGYAFLFGKFNYFWGKQQKLGRWITRGFKKPPTS
ncbi:MAG: DUF6787 family protein [Bacteroidia bacterium]